MSDSGLEQVSAEQDGRVLTGVGVSQESLEQTMERHAVDVPDASSSDPAASPETPKAPRGAKRFDQLTAEREDAKRRAEVAEKERDDLKAKLTQPAAEVAKTAPVVVAPGTAPAASAPVARPKPTEDEVGTKYKSYAEFAEDLADWKFEERLAKLDLDGRVRSGIEADRAHRSLADHVQSLYAKGRESYQDFDQIVNNGPGSNVELSTDTGKAEQRLNAVLRLPHAEHILYALGKDAAETARLAALSDVEFGLALAKFSPASMSVASPASTGARVVVAPPPFQPVGSGSKTTVIPSSDLPKRAGYDFDKSGYREKRAAERGIKSRR